MTTAVPNPVTPAYPTFSQAAQASLYVGDLDPSVNEAVLYETFNAVGPVVSVRVCRDAATRTSLGYGYVNYHSFEDAERALDNLNFKEIRGRPCRIMWNQRDPTKRKSNLGNIFIKNLDKSIDNKTLYDSFSIFGNILSCKVATSASTRESLGYGFVHFDRVESAKEAIAKTDGKIIGESKISVQEFKSKRERERTSVNRFNNLYVKNLPQDVTDEALKELFGKHGSIISSKLVSRPAIKKDEAAAEPGTEGKETKDALMSFFAFVAFETPDQAAAALEALNNNEFNGSKLYVNRHQSKEQRSRELKARFEQFRVERRKNYAGCNLYVRHLPDDIDDTGLVALFAPHGTIVSAKVQRDPRTGKPRGFGYVCFSKKDEATKAVTEMNGFMVKNKPLYVALHQYKDVRIAQLQSQFAGRFRYMMTPMGPMMFPPQMFYPAGPQDRMMMPPQAQGQPGAPVPRGPRFNGAPMMYPPMVPGGPMRMPGPHGAPMMYSMVPAPHQHQGPYNGQPRNFRGGRGGRGRGGAGRPGVIPNGQPGRFEQGRAQPAGASAEATEQVHAETSTAAAGTQAVAAEPSSFLTQLSEASEERKKEMIGERLYPLIENLTASHNQPDLAGKITGMLLEMDNGELIHLMESQAALSEKVNEAIEVLKTATTSA